MRSFLQNLKGNRLETIERMLILQKTNDIFTILKHTCCFCAKSRYVEKSERKLFKIHKEKRLSITESAWKAFSKWVNEIYHQRQLKKVNRKTEKYCTKMPKNAGQLTKLP